MLTIERKALVEELGYVQSLFAAAASVPDQVAPGATVHLSLEQGRLLLTQDDGQAFLRSAVAVDGSLPNTRAAIRGDKLLEYLKLVKEKQVQFEIDSRAVRVRHETGEVSVPSALVYPPVRVIHATEKIVFDRKALAEMLGAVSFAALKGWHAYVSGTLCEIANGKMSVVATDGTLMALSSVDAPDDGAAQRVVIPAKGLAALQKAVKYEQNDFVSLAIGEHNIHGVVGAREFVVANGEGKFPKYQAVIPTSHEYRMDCDREDLLKALRIAAAGYPIVDVKLALDEVSLSSPDASSVIHASYNGQPHSLRMDVKQLTGVLSNCPSDRIELLVSDRKPLLFQTLDGRTRYIVSPVTK